MSRPVRFNFTSVSATSANLLAFRTCLFSWKYENRSWSSRWPVGRRAADLLLHWWAVGHDRRRHVLTCPECEGDGHIHNADYDYACGTCTGCGFVDRTDKEIDTRRDGYYGKC